MDIDFIFPKTRPGEWLAGYRSRVASWNGADTAKELAKLIGQAFPQVRGQDMTTAFIHVAAEINGTTPDDLMLRHSCRHVLIGLKQVGQDFQSARARTASWSQALYSPDQFVRSCPRCVQEDLERGPFAHWRRNHQVPGLYRCPMHACPLRIAVARDLPPHYPDSAVSVPFIEDADLAVLAKCQPVTLAVGLLNAVVERGLTLTSAHVATRLRARLHLENERLPSAQRLAEWVDAAYPPTWIRHFMPRAETLSPGALKNCLLIGRPVAYQHVALIAGLIYESADEALSDLQAPAAVAGGDVALEPWPAAACGSNSERNGARGGGLLETVQEQARHPIDLLA